MIIMTMTFILLLTRPMRVKEHLPNVNISNELLIEHMTTNNISW